MKHLRAASALLGFFVLLTGLAFPILVWAVGQAVFPWQAAGSMLRDGSGKVVGSALIGQKFTKPEYFQPRPSAAGAGYDAANSSGTNLGPTSAKLVNGTADDPATPDLDETYFGIRDLAKAYRADNGLRADAIIPADAATRSASGLDPDISPENARLQVTRIARTRALREEAVQKLVSQHTQERVLGFIGEPRVNVLRLNLALDALK
jgi:potassium-transporting ATPase KdpC subunit